MKNYCPKCKGEIIPGNKGVKCSVCDWKAKKPKPTLAPPKVNKACGAINKCFHSDQVGISKAKCMRCHKGSNFQAIPQS